MDSKPLYFGKIVFAVYYKNPFGVVLFMAKVEVTKELIAKVAKNARLNLTDAELERFVPQIKEIIVDSFSKLDEIDAKEEPSFQPVAISNRMRKDEVKKGITQEEALKNASAKLRENGYFKGPKVMQ